MLRGGLLPYKLHIRTSRSTVEGYLQAVTSRQDVTCRSCVDKERHVMSCHVTSGRHRRRRGQGGRHVTSRPVKTSQAPPWTRMPSRHVTSGNEAPLWTRRPSRHVVSGCQAPPSTRRPSRHVTSRHDVRRPQSGPCSNSLDQQRCHFMILYL